MAGNLNAGIVNAAQLKSDQWLNANGTENFKCRAWLYASLVGGVPIALGSGNISSLTDLAVGKFSANFTINMPDENYAASLTSNKADYSNSFAYESAQRTISQVTIQNKQDDAASSDGYFSVAIFR